MVLSLTLAGLTLRVGLRLRSARRRRMRPPSDETRRHLRLAKPTLAFLVLGFGGGVASSVWLRGFEPFDTAHALASVSALGLFLAAGAVGRSLEKRRSRAVELHALLGVLAALAAAAAFGTGFVLLP